MTLHIFFLPLYRKLNIKNMKTKEELKEEQYDLKAKLHEIIEFINGEEYAGLTPREKGFVNQQRTGMEIYLNALTNRIYSKDEFFFDASNAMWPLMMSSIFTSSSSWGSSSNLDYLKKQLDEKNFEDNDITDHAV